MKPWMRVSLKHPEHDAYTAYDAEEMVLYPPVRIESDQAGVIRVFPIFVDPATRREERL